MTVLRFNFDEMTAEQQTAVFDAEKCLQAAGLFFGTDATIDNEKKRISERQWFLDELTGAELVQPKQENE